MMWPTIGKPDGTFFFSNKPNMLDQILVNKNMAHRDSLIKADISTVEILRFPGTFSSGRYPKPKPFGGMGKPVNKNGFSDHFPIATTVTEAD